MANTTNFGWETPDDTDLVKDGAAAMRTLGSAIDTSMADLKGGTSGQILTKNSNTDMDFIWAAANPGDITGVTAGTGISGGGTSGDVTITNSMATAIDAKGDLIAGTGADTFSRLAVGTNGQVLIADSTAATGLKWGAAGSAFSGVSVYLGASLSVATSTTTTIQFDNERFDTDGFHDNVTNKSRLTVPAGKGGYYAISFAADMILGSNAGNAEFLIRKNGTTYIYDGYWARSDNASSSYPCSGSATIYANLAAGDYVEFQVWHNNGSSRDYVSGTSYSHFAMTYLGA